MTRLQHRRSTLPLYVCDTCGSADKINRECTACLTFELTLEYDRLTELYLEDLQDRDEMKYVDEFGDEF